MIFFNERITKVAQADLCILPDPLASIIGRCTLYTPG